MTPTPYAESIREDVHAIVARAQAVLARQRSFDIAQLERSFTIQCHDALACALGPTLVAGLRTAAPQVSLRLMAEAPTDTPELRKGQVDLHIGAAIPAQADIQHALLGHDTMVVAMRAEHPLVGVKLTARRYAGAEHIIVSRRGRLRDPVDDALAAQSLARTTVASAPTAAAALCMASASDLLVVVPRSACASLVRAFALVTTPLPVRVPALPVIASWHLRHEGDRAHEWLRKAVADVTKSMLEAG